MLLSVIAKSYFHFRIVNNINSLKEIMYCIVHYKNQSAYSTLKILSDTNITRIQEARLKRLEIGGSYRHEDQCQLIPEQINLELHGVHLELCYKQ